MTRIYFFKSNGLTKKDQVKMTKVGTNMLSDTAKRRQKDGNETATSDKVIIRTSLGHFLRYVAMVTLLLTLACGEMWGVTKSATQFTASQSGTTYTVSAKSGYGDLSGLTVTTVCASGGVTSNRLKVPAGTFNIATSDGTTPITAITITWRNSSNQYPTSNSECTVNTGTATTSSQTTTWSGSATSVSFTNTTANTFQVVGLSVTYGASYYYRGADNSWGATAMTISAGGTYEYYATTTNNHQFKIALSADGWDYNYTYVAAGFYGTTSNIGDYSSNNCYVWSAPANYYIVVFKPNTAINTTNNPKICATTSNTLPKDQFTISFDNGGGSGTMSSITSINAGENKTTTANTFTKAGYRFAGWKANVDVKVGGSTKTAGTVLADGVTIQNILSDITLTAQWEERSCPVSGTVYSLTMKSATLSSVTQNTEVALATTYATDDGGTSYLGNKNSDAAKAQVVSSNSGCVYFNGNDAYIKIVLDCPIQTGDELTFTNGSGSRQICITTSTTRATTYTTSSNSYTFPAAFNNASTIYVWRSESGGTYLHSLTITRTASCGATQPGEIGKGSLSNCSITLTAANSPAANNTWYWQSASDGTATNLGSGATKSVSTPGTYYIRSYFSTGSCWSDARSVTVTEGDLTPAAPTSLTAASTTAKGTTFTVTGAGTSNFEFYVSTESTAPVAGTGATYSAASTTKTIDDKVAGTTYYAWVRAVCGSYKSGWTALTGNTFTTSTVTVTHTLTNVSKTSGEATAGGSDYTAVYAADAEYSMPTPTVTIDGNTATSGTDYTWNAGTGTITIPANKINGNIVITLNSVPSAPSSAVISGTYHYFPGENISLTCTPSGNNGPTTYQWYKGGKENGNAIEGATSATYTKNSCTFDDAGSYYCKVTCNATSIWAVTNSHENYDVKILRLYVKGSKGGQDYGNVDFVKVNSTTATASISLGSNWTYGFNIADGCGHYYGNSGTMQYNSYGPWVTNQNGVDCGLTTTNAATYVFTINYSNLEMIETTVTFPSGNQTSGKVIYFDNNDLQWENVYYRIGKNDHVQSAAMTKVYGTANLYQYTTPTYNNFAGWHITNAAGATGSYSVYNTKNGTAITEATAFEGAAVTQAAVTVTPTSSHATGETSDNNNCEFYTYGITTGMKTQNVEISPYTNGTITVNYTNTSNVASTLTSGNADLAHSVILTSITAVPNTGYDASAITINGGAYSANYVVTGATTIAATFSLHNYNVTYSNPGNGNSYTIKVADGSATSESKTATMGQTITIVASPATGYDFTGWTITKAGGGTVEPVNASATTTTFTMPTDDVTITASFTLKTYTVTYNTGSGAGISGSHANDTKTHGVSLTLPGVTFTRTGYTQTGWATSDGGSQAYALSGSYTDNAAANLYPVWTAKTTTITINANTANHGSTTPGSVTATYGSALPSFTAASGVGDWSLTGYWTAATGGNKIINADGTLVASTSYADGSSLWNSEAATLTLYAQYEEECTPQTISKVVLTAVDAGTVSGYNENEYAGAAVIGGLKSTNTAEVDASHAGVETGYKLNDNGKGIVFATLAKGTFQVGDVIKVTITYPNDNHTFAAPVSSKEALELFYGTNKDDATSLTILTGVSAAGTYSYTLTAADVTAIGSKKGIGVFRHSDRKQNPFVYSVEIYGCRDWVIEEDGLVNWTMNLNTNTWGTSSTSTTDETNISSISTSANTTDGTREGTTKKINLASAADNVNNAASFTFSLNSAKKIEPEKVTCKVFNVGDDEGLNYKAQLSDDNGHVYYSTNTVIPNTEATLTDAVFNFASDLILTGDITVKVYCWKSSGSGSAFRMGPKIRFFGEVQSAADYTVTHTLSNVTKSAGATSVKEGNNYTATYAASSGYTLPSTITVTIGGSPATAGTDYTWTQGTGVVTIPGNKVTGNIVITVTGVEIITYSITYHCNGAESGCPSDVAAATNLPSPLPSAPTKDGYDFGGWYTDSECTVAAVAGAALTANTDLYAKWTERGSECEDTPHAWDVIATSAKSYKVRISKVTEEVAIPVADATASNLTAYAGSVSTNDNVTVQIADGGSSKYGYKFDGSNTYLKLVFSTPLVLNDTLVVGMTNASHNISFTTTAVRSTTLSTSGGKLIIPAALAGQSTLYLWRGSGSTMYLRSFAVKHECEAIPSCTTPTLPTATLSNQTVCEGSDIAAWDATPTNASTISGKSESISYSWKKKGNDTELATTATFDLGASAAESQAGTYVVTVTVSKAGYASSTATKEVELSVTEGEEVTGITADKATVYPGNSVTLTATANTPATWQWYTCTNAEGDGEAIISGAESASYTITSAGAAGTYYYKAKATGSCGTAERVYTLTVTAASECEKYFWFVYAADATSNGVINNRDNFFGSSPKTGSSNSSSYKFTLDGTEYTATRNTGDNTFSISFTVPEGSTATLALNCKGSSSKPIYLIPTSGDPVLITDNSSNAAHVVENIAAGTYRVGAKTDASASWTLAGMAVQVCTASSCTDATPTIAAVNNTVCVGTKMRIDATGYEDGASFKWQKLNGSTWDDVAGAILDSLVIASAAAENAGSYRFIATKGCSRTSNTVTIAVPTLPNFGSTVPASVSVMQTIALSINTVEATDAVKYRWYKSADPTWDAGDVEIGTNKELIKAYDSEAIGSPSYYIFCRAQNACGITTSSAIAVNVTAYVEEDCATRGNESDAEFGFQNSGAGQGSYESTACWTMNSNSKILVYSAPDGKYFKTAKVTIASSSESKASYNWSTNGGTSYTAVSLTVNSTLTERTINLSTHGNVDAFQIGRNFDSKGSSSGTLYVSKICFEYTDACTATTVTASPTSKTYEMDGSSFTEPTFTVKHGGTAFDPQPTLTYSSSNEDIASVDDDGTVTFNGDAGTVTITASYAGDGTYCASSGSYTITVSCPGGAPKIVPASSVDLSGCNSSVTLHAKKQDGTAFDDGTYQWFRNGEEIDGATSSSYTATQAGTYTVERTNTSDCTTPSTNSAVVTSETTEPEVERLVPFQYYHVNKTYSDQMKMRHLFAVKNSGTLDGKHFKMYVSRNGGAATDVTSSDALVVWSNGDGHVDTVMVDLNKLSDKKKYSENDELVFTCKAIDCNSNISDVYKNTITMNVIGATPTLALICSGSSKAEGTRKTGELTVGGDFLTGYNVADLCQQTGNTSFDANTEWGLYTDLKTQYIVTPVNGYAVFNKLNYEPFDILLLTDYPKASKSDAAKDVLDDMAALCDYRPMLSFKTHMVAKSPSKWAAKGFTTAPAVPKKADGRLNLNIVCYAHPMFESIKTGADVYEDVANTSAPLVYTMLTGEGYEGKKGMQGFEIAAAENFVTIGLIHDTAFIDFNEPITGQATWRTNPKDRMLVTVAERQTNIEARFILFSLNCGAQSKLTDKGEQVILACLEYLLDDDPLHVADCSFTFDNGEGNMRTPEEQAINCPSCPPAGDHKWNNPANWGPDYRLLPGEFTSVRIKKPVEVNDEHAHVMEVRIIDEGRIDIPAGKALDVKSTIRRMDGSEIYPTDVNDIHIGSASIGNGTLIFNNDEGDTKARVDMYSTAKADMVNMSAATSTWQYIGTPHNDVQIATYNYYDSWLYQYDTSSESWVVIPNGGPLVPFRGYCVTHPQTNHTFEMYGKLVATTNVDLDIPAGKYVVVANSWVAPIDINAITADDMEGITDQTIYFFNTGSDTEGTGGTGTAAGTYRATPINAASYTGDWQIPSMQGFYVVGGSSNGTLHLDYNRHVRPTGDRTIVSNQMYAPRRAGMSDEPNVLKIFARGSRYQDKLVVLEREDFTRGYDSGWDGEAWGGSDLSPMVYVTGEGREDAVSAIPEFEGTVVAFKAGEDSEYRLEFVYSEDAEPLYLYDTENNTYTQIINGNAYYFTATDKAPHSRFILTRKNPQVATGVGEVPSAQVLSTKAKKLLIEDKMFIMVNGMLYDATGKVVK